MSFEVSQNLKAAALMTPEKVAVILANGSRLSFRQLDRECDRFADTFYRKGIRAGMRVVVLVRPGLAFVPTLFGCFRIGAIPVCIDPGMKLKHVFNCIREAQPSAMIASRFVLWLSYFFRSTFSSVIYKMSLPWIIPGRVPSDTNETHSTECTAAATAAILFTSGSTGVPKGVAYSHGAFQQQMNLLRDSYGIGTEEIDLVVFPLFALFSAAWGITAVIPKMNPANPSRASGKHLAELIERFQVTHTAGSPAIWKNLADYCETNQKTCPSLLRILMAGAQVPEKLVRRCSLLAKEIHTPYGATEALPVSTISNRELNSTYELTRQGKGTCVGKAVTGLEVAILPLSLPEDPGEWETALVFETFEIGEIVVRASWVTQEYFNKPEANRQSKVTSQKGAWHRMGDVGYFDDQKRIWFCGRKDHLILTDCGTLFPDPIEAIFDNHPKVSRSALIGIGPKGRQKPALVIETSVQDPALLEELREYAKRFTATLSIKDFHVWKRFPVDVRHNIKIDRLRLAEWIGQEA